MEDDMVPEIDVALARIADDSDYVHHIRRDGLTLAVIISFDAYDDLVGLALATAAR